MRRVPALFAVICALSLVLASCQAERKATGFPPPKPGTQNEHGGGHGGEGGGGGGNDKEQGGELTGPIEVVDSAFEPKVATVKVGTTVEWSQTGTAPHNVQADEENQPPKNSSPGCSGQATNKCMQKGDTYDFTFEKAGEYPYYCVIHGGPGGIGMAGTIVVE